MNYVDLIGTPFKYGGRSLEDGGLDCYGVVVEMGRRNGQSFPVRQFSENLQINHALMSCQMSEWEKCEPAPGTVALIRLKKIVCHVGYLIDDFQFVHAWEGTNGVVVEKLEEWRNRIEGYYRYVGNNR